MPTPDQYVLSRTREARGGCFAQSSDGDLYLANGIDPVRRWPGYGAMQPAGTAYPVSAPTVVVTPVVTGAAGSPTDVPYAYYVYVSFVRADGRESALSPVASDSGTVSVGADQTFTGANAAYTNLPISTDSRVISRRIYRTTSAQARVAYLDVDVGDNSATSASSTRSDAELQAQLAYPLFTADYTPSQFDRSPPPDTKPFIAWHLGLMYFAGDRPYTAGSVSVTANSTTVKAYGTMMPTTFAGREFWVPNAPGVYAIASVVDNADNTQTVTLATQYKGTTDKFSAYTVRAPLAVARVLYYSLSGQPEYCPPYAGLELPDDGDVDTGLMTMGAFLYILRRRHIYRLTTQSDPAKDGGIYLSSNRGCVNNNCCVVIGEDAVMLDEQGVHRFSGSQDSTPLSGPVQDYFDGTGASPINWNASEFFHGAHDPAVRVVRFFVCLRGDHLPAHCLVVHLDSNRWWVELRPVPVGASATGPGGRASTFLGGPFGAAYLSSGSDLDAVPSASGVRTKVLSSSPLSVTTQAPAEAPAGTPVAVVSGRGRGQVRVIASSSGSVLKLTWPWSVRPDDTSVIQVGGIPYRYETNRFQFVGTEGEGERAAQVRFVPRAGQEMGLEVYRDFEADAIAPAATLNRRDNAGVTVTKGDPVAVIDLAKPSGSAAVRLNGHKELFTDGTESIRVALSGVGASPAPVVTGLVLKGVV